jgi:integrase
MKVLIRPKRCFRPMGLAIKSKTITKNVLMDVVGKIKEVEHPFFVLYFENLYLLAYETGARISEIAPIHETDLDLRYGVVHYGVRKKRKKPQETSKFLTPELLDRLREHVKQYRFQIEQSGGYIFFGMSSSTSHITVRTAERHFEMARDAAGHGSVYGESRPLYKITNIKDKPQQFNVYGKIEQDGREVEVITRKITVLPNESIVRAIEPKRYEGDKRFKVEFAYTRKLRRCTVHSMRHLSIQTVMEERGLFEAYDHADHISITSTMEYLDANPAKRKSRADVFRNLYLGNGDEQKKPKMSHAIRDDQPVDINQMSIVFSQMAELLANMQGQEKQERLSGEFDAVMRMKAEQGHKKAFAEAQQTP